MLSINSSWKGKFKIHLTLESHVFIVQTLLLLSVNYRTRNKPVQTAATKWDYCGIPGYIGIGMRKEEE